MPSPTALSLKYLRDRGFAAEVVERWLPIEGKRIRRDLFHCIDLIAVHGRLGIILGVQTTSLTNIAARLTKAKEQPELRQWLQAGGTFEVHGWYRRGARWQVRVVALRGDELEAVPLRTPVRRGRRPVQRTLFELDVSVGNDSGTDRPYGHLEEDNAS